MNEEQSGGGGLSSPEETTRWDCQIALSDKYGLTGYRCRGSPIIVHGLANSAHPKHHHATVIGNTSSMTY